MPFETPSAIRTVLHLGVGASGGDVLQDVIGKQLAQPKRFAEFFQFSLFSGIDNSIFECVSIRETQQYHTLGHSGADQGFAQARPKRISGSCVRQSH